MCSAKMVAVDKKESDEEDDSFERVDRPETSEAGDDNTSELLIAAMEESKLHHAEFMKEMERRRRSKKKHAVIYGILLAAYAVYIAANLRATPAPSTSTPPPVASPAQECPQAPECPKNCDSRRTIRFANRWDEGGSYIPIPFKFGFQDGFVTEVEPNSNAHLAGLEVGDQILKVDGIDLENESDKIIFERICYIKISSDSILSHLQHAIRRITGYKPEHCDHMNYYIRDDDLHIEVRKNVRAFVRAQKIRCFLVGCVMTALLAAIIIIGVKKIRRGEYEWAELDRSCSEEIERINKHLAKSDEEKKKDLNGKEKDEADKQEDRHPAMCLAREKERKKRGCEETVKESSVHSWENGTWPKAN